MAETKNTFIKSKMNKDLDERLVPNGEYRDAINVQVSQAEESDVGTLSTSLGNLKITDFDLTNNCEARIIGYFADEKDKDVYVFITNFIDTSPSKLSNYPSSDAICQIWRRNIETNLNTKLVEGNFLNLSITHEVLNVNLLEDLLFWTDNRNQPRKINVKKANPGNITNPIYYTNEDQISVAKYYPFEPISLLNNYIVNYTLTSNGGGTNVSPAGYFNILDETVPTTGGSGSGLTVKITSTTSAVTGNLVAVEIINQGIGYENGDIINIAPRTGTATITLVIETQSTMKDRCTELLPVNASFVAGASGTLTSDTSFGWTLDPDQDVASINWVGTLVKILNSGSSDVTPLNARVTSVNIAGTSYSINIAWLDNPQTISLTSTSTLTLGINPDYDANWPGDCEFLKDKFVRFAYRFKFDDNEYSLISPFTQPCFVPNQNGYFLSETRGTETIYDSEFAYESTDNEVFQNQINSVAIKIPSPSYLDSSSSFFSNITEKMHVEEIDIIYKDDSENVLKVLDTITKSQFENINESFLFYDYQSRAPIRVLPSDEITRVSDKVPLRSLTQEVSGNRVIYGNYVDGHTSNSDLNYQVSTAEKFQLAISDIRKEYQNHTLKQNRTYQVGVVLSDRYGRQSDVILSSLDNSTSFSGVTYSGSTIFHSFYSADPGLIDGGSTWGGDAISVQFNSQIPTNTGQLGYPKLFIGYAAPSFTNLYGGAGYAGPGATGAATTGGSGTGLTVDYVTFKSSGLSYIISVIINNPGSGYVLGDIITITGGSTSATFIYNPGVSPNLTGWYSYKIVVKQQEQDYYNVYVPGIVNGAVNRDGISSNIEASLSLYGDNINKVPKDLLDVGPSQTNYRSSVDLSLRVQNVLSVVTSRQFYPGTDIEKVTTLSELTDLGVSLNKISQEIQTLITTTTFDLLEFNQNVEIGSSVIVTDNVGGSRVGSSEGIYINSYVSTTGNKARIILSKEPSSPIQATDIITFGPPGVVYNGNNNPIIGVLSTSKAIGVSEEAGFATTLAVFETKPTKSLLDIFYESTTAGLIDSLNAAVLDGSVSTSAGSVSPIAFSLTEAQTGSVVCTNSFQPLDLTNTNILDPNTTGSLISVFDQTLAPRNSDFQLISANNGSFTIQSTLASGSGFYIGNNVNNTIFDFNIKLTNNGVDVFKSFIGRVENIEPIYNGSYDGGTYSVSKSLGGILKDSSGNNEVFSAYNGSGDLSLRENELKWTLIDIIPIDGENNPPPAGLVADNLSTDWPTVILQPGETRVHDYQIILNQSVRGGNFGGLAENISSIIGTEVNNFSTLVKINSLSAIGSFSVTFDPDGDPTVIQSYLNFFSPNNLVNDDPVTDNINLGEAISFIKWQLTFKVEDGGGLPADTISITVVQQ